MTAPDFVNFSTTPSSLPVLLAAALSSFGVDLLLAQSGGVPQDWAQLGGSAALITAMVIALRYMRTREEKAVEQTEKGNLKVVALLTEDRDQWRGRARELEEILVGEGGPKRGSDPG